MADMDAWERLIGSLGVPAAILFFLFFVGWRCARAVAPHLPTLVGAYKLQAEAAARLTEQTARHTEMLDAIHGDVGQVKEHVKVLVDRR